MYLEYRKDIKGKGISADEVMMPEEALARRRRVLFMYGPITTMSSEGIRLDWFSPHAICDALLLLDELNHEPIWMVIESPGGYVDSALYIYDTMKSVKSPVHTVVRDAASAAVTIAAGGTAGHRYIYPHTRILIHQPSAHFGDMKATEQKKAAKEMMGLYKKMAQIFKECGAKPSVQKIMADMQAETYLDAQQAINYGILDKMVTGELWTS